MNATVYVRCPRCGWHTHRAWKDCECEYNCGHRGFGKCPKCGIELQTPAEIREEKEHDAKPVYCHLCPFETTVGEMWRTTTAIRIPGEGYCIVCLECAQKAAVSA